MYEFLTLKFVLISERELNRKLPNIAGKNLRMTKKASHTDVIKKTSLLVLIIDACTTAKHKIILSWPSKRAFQFKKR